MQQIGRFVRSVIAGAVMVAGMCAAQAVVISSSSNNPYTFNWSFNSVAGALTGTGTMTLSGFNSSSLTIAITLNNTSGLSSNRLTSFGFGINPNATGITFSDANDGGMVGATLDNIPSLNAIEVCAWGGNNCSGGGNGGILGGGSDSFSVILAGTWGDSVDIAPIGFKYQTGSGSFEFTTASSTTTTSTSGGNLVPEPLSATLVGLGLAIAGLTTARRRRVAAA